MDALWRIEMLGGLRAMQGDRALTRFRTQKTGSLLAYLACHLQASHSREVLVECLWPECTAEAGRHSLSMALSSLRHQLEPPGVATGTVLMADRFSVRLNQEAVSTDVADFEAALQRAEQAANTSERVQCLAEAVECYRSEFLLGYYDEWVLPEQRRLAALFFQALQELVSHCEQQGDFAAAVQYAHKGVTADPLEEEIHRELMRLHAASGQFAAALQQYEELKRLLHETLGEEPSAATQEVLRAIEQRRSRAQKEEPALLSSRRTLVKPPATRRPIVADQQSVPATGTVTFLCADVEEPDPTKTPQKSRKSTRAAYRTVLRQAFQRHGGHGVPRDREAVVVAFARASDALAAAIEGHRTLAAHEPSHKAEALHLRMALHTGEATPEGGGYHGSAVRSASRLLAAAHAGQILCSEESAALLRRDLPPGVGLTDLGVYRLRGVQQPERLFQVEYPGMAMRDFPPPNATAGYASNLPLQLGRFFGRTDEIEQLERLLQQKGLRLATLTGPGGSGKTRLALEVAKRTLDAFHGAVWFVSLADLSEGRLVADAIRDALGLPRSHTADPLEQVLAALRRQPALLVLDNFEHLLAGTGDGGRGTGEASSAHPHTETPTHAVATVLTLLGRVSSLKCLITSRRPLRVEGEHEFVVHPLPVPSGPHSPEGLVRCESVQLFVDRAQAVRPDFQVTVGNAAALAELCGRLEGLPLALELAAAWSSVLTPSQMLAQLAHRFDFPVSRKRDVTARHRTLRATLDWSYQLLSPELQRFFARLSVFRGGWTVEAAEAVCGDPRLRIPDRGLAGADGAEVSSFEAGIADRRPEIGNDILDHLAQLRDCSLLFAEERAEVMRFRMLETVRQYGLAKLAEAGEDEAVRNCHLRVFLRMAEEAEPNLAGPEQATWFNRLEAGHDNLRAALQWSMAHGTEAGCRLAVALGRFWEVRGHWAEGRRWIEGMLAAQSTLDPALRGGLLGWAGSMACHQGDHVAAGPWLEQSLEILRTSGSTKDLAEALNRLGHQCAAQGNNERAAELLHESLALCREQGHKHTLAEALMNLAWVLEDEGDMAGARAAFEEALPVAREIRDPRVLGRTLKNVAYIETKFGEYGSALAHLEESLLLREALGDKQGIADTLDCLARVWYQQADYERGAQYLRRSLALFREVGDKGKIAWGFFQLSTMAFYTGDVQRAARLLGAKIALYEAMALTPTPTTLQTWEYWETKLREGLGEAAFAKACAEGRGMSMDQAVDYALAEDDA